MGEGQSDQRSHERIPTVAMLETVWIFPEHERIEIYILEHPVRDQALLCI
jgi:hypothetical protein